MKGLMNRRSLVLAAASVLYYSTTIALAGTADPSLAGSVDRARRATVGVLSIGQGAPGLPGPSQLIARGSGFHVKDGYIVTARHVVEREEGAQNVVAKEITVLTSDLEELPASLIGASSYVDVAVYRITGAGAASLAPAAFAEKEPEPGDEVFMVGFPLGWGPAIGFGRIGNPNTFLPTVNTRLMQLDASACAGNSGGGLFNPRGEVVGIVHAIIHTDGTQEDRRCSQFAFAIPVTLANRIVTALMQGSQPVFSRLGIQLTAVKVGTKWQASVLEAIGPAHDGGIRRGDILLAIDDTPITDAAQLKNYLIERTVPGQKVAVRVLRGQTEHVLTVTLGKS